MDSLDIYGTLVPRTVVDEHLAAKDAYIKLLIERVEDWERAEMARLPQLGMVGGEVGGYSQPDMMDHVLVWRPRRQDHTFSPDLLRRAINSGNAHALVQSVAEEWANKLAHQLAQIIYPNFQRG